MNAPKKDLLQPVDGQARRLAQTLLRTARFAALGTLDGDGSPFVSRIGVATTVDGQPVWLISQLSSHFHNLAADQRCSLLVGEPGKGDPLAHPRLTLVARARCIKDEAARRHVVARYLARHAKAALYADFPDFAFWTADVVRGSLNGGFGKAYAIEPHHMRPISPAPASFDEVDGVWLEEISQRHASAVDDLAALSGGDGSGWQVATLDPEGVDVVRADRCRRMWFERPLSSPQELPERLAQGAQAFDRPS